MPSVESVVWNVVNKKVCVQFGKDCSAAAVWTLAVLLLRLTALLCRIEHLIPLGMLFSVPFAIEALSAVFPLQSPILSVRIAESIVARESPLKLLSVIPAHFLGCVIGLVWFRTLIPFAPNEVFTPVHCDAELSLAAIVSETVANVVYATVMLVLPYLLDVNRLSHRLVSLPILPVLLFSGSTCNPGLVYGLWIVNSNLFGGSVCPLNISRIGGALLGAVLAGWICSIYFPDDSSTWARKSKKN